MRTNSGEEGDDLAAVAALEAAWERIWASRPVGSASDLDELLRRWEPLRPKDPIALELDLLSPLGDERYEPAHTRVLAYLLDPRARHGLGDAVLQRFLDAVTDAADEISPELLQVLRDLEGIGDDALVQAERQALLSDDQEERRSRTDLWLELPASAPRLLLIVENKIDDEARPGQLEAYEAAIALRLAELKRRGLAAPLVMKMYLTPDGAPPPHETPAGGWHPISYFALGANLALILESADAPHAADYLRLYLATVFQRVLNFSYRSPVPRWQRPVLATYLRVRLGEAP